MAVYNGEVYGVSRGDFGDGQRILDAVESGGIEALRSMDGMFALCILDVRESCLYLARDPFGIKPLYFSISSGTLLAASEIKALASLDRVESIALVGPGDVLCFRGLASIGCVGPEANPAVQNSWKNLCVGGSCGADASEIRAALLRSVEGCIATAPGPIGVFLSGGVDSGALYCLARRFRKDVVGIVGGAAGLPDFDAASRLVREVGGTMIEAPIASEEELFSRYPEIVRIAESYEPNVVRQSAVFFEFAKRASESGLRVCLCGEGADELFCGYPEFLASRKSDWELFRHALLGDLHRTQLQRVDRIAMHFTLEVRVPFLSREIASLALGIRSSARLFEEGGDGSANKLALREALRGLIPDWLRNRPKVVLSEGCGLGGNHPTRGMFFSQAIKALEANGFSEQQTPASEWFVANAEEALYFREFEAYGFTKATFLKERSTTNAVSSLKGELQQ